MSEVTWLLILGAIAIIFPIALTSVVGYVGEDIDLNLAPIESFYGDGDPALFTLFEELTTGDFDYNITRQAWLDGYIDISNEYPTFPSKWFFDVRAFFGINNTNWVQRHINLEAFGIVNPVGVGTDNAIVRALGLDTFFNAMNMLPTTLRLIIYSFYVLFTAYLIWRTLPFT